MEESTSLNSGKLRRHDSDWLTVGAMLTVFLFHCARFFNQEDWHVKNNQLSDGMSLFVAIVVQWIMPLFFVLSGISSYYSLAARDCGAYLKDRFRRLVIPLIFGMFVVLVPVQVWIERFSHGQFQGGFLEFYPHYFNGLYPLWGNFAWMGLHLWYLEVLFVFTLLTLPLFLHLKKAESRELLSRAAAFFSKGGNIFLLAIPLLIVELLVDLQPKGVGARVFGGWSLFSYLIFFPAGFLIASDARYTAALIRLRYASLVLGLLSTGLISSFHFRIAPTGDWTYAAEVFVRSCNSWFWLTAILGFGSKYLNFENAFLKYAREAVLPFYVLHQTVIVIIGFQIAHWEAGVMVKYLLLSTVSFAVIVALYHLLVQRINILRFLFGMKVNK
ncbi:MAG: hypothetical protein EG826_17200 [Deltaproteobacteria bacterium]|nr:hypothetical protein [Deltaproteobacteria bacterium]